MDGRCLFADILKCWIVNGWKYQADRSISHGKLIARRETIQNMLFSDLMLMGAIFLSCALVYLVFWSGHQYSIDGMAMFQYAKALLFQRSFAMQPPLRWENVEYRVSTWPLGLTLFYVPALAVLSVIPKFQDASFREIPYNSHEFYNPALLNDRAYHYVSFVNPVLTAMTAALLYYFCLQIGCSHKQSAACALVYGLLSPAAVYARFDFAQPLAALLLLAAVVLVLHFPHKGWMYFALSGFMLGMGYLTRPELLVIACIPIALFILQGVRGSAVLNGHPIKSSLLGLAALLLPVAVFVILSAYLNYLRFGNWLATGYGRINELFVLTPFHITRAVLANSISPGRGILIFFPLSLLSILGIFRLFRRNHRLGTLFALIMISAMLLYSAWVQWAAGISWGPRFLIPILPFLAALAFLGYHSLGGMTGRLKNTILAILIIMGAIISIQGQLFNFLDDYGAQSHSPGEILSGDYHFDFRTSPIFAGWDDLGNPANYDLHWLQAGRQSRLRLVVLPGIGIGLALLGVYWIRFFSIESLSPPEKIRLP
jgi:hypothetical protein